MRAPPPSLIPMIGQPVFSAWSMTLTIFSPKTSPSDPPNTVKSWLNTQTGRPSTVPYPVTTPSPYGRLASMPKSCDAVPGELVELDERALVEQHADPLPGGHLAPVVLLGHRPLRAGVHGLVPPSLQVGELARGGVRIGRRVRFSAACVLMGIRLAGRLT